jgi:HEAT repeat protein
MSTLTRTEQRKLKNLRKTPTAKGRETRTPTEKLDELLALTQSDDPDVRCEAARNLCPCHIQANHPQIWDRLIKMAHDPDPHVRTTILHTLADGSPREREQQIVETLESLYNDTNPKVRKQVRYILAQYRHKGKLNVL